MDRRYKQLALIIIVGIAVRLLIFHDVAVNGDTGLYLYDAQQILWGKQMFVDFPSRSPVFQYALALVLWFGYSPLISARLFMIAIAAGLGVAIYMFARQLHSHTAGLIAALLYMLTPFSLVWGLWVKTEPAAGLLLLLAFIIALAYIDRPAIPYYASIAIGLLFGLAFLVRRVAIIHIGAFAVFVLWYRWSQVDDIRETVTSATLVVSTAVGSLLVIYFLLARGDLQLTTAIAYQHAVTLFTSNGQGSLGWIYVGDAPSTATWQATAWWEHFCQKCGENTTNVITRTTLLTLPVLLLFLPATRSYLNSQSKFLGDTALPTGIFVVSALGLLTLTQHVYFWEWPTRFIALIVLMLAVIFVWLTLDFDFFAVWNPKYALPILILAGLSAGYLYRDRILYVTYFQDFYPFLVVLAAIALVEYIRANRHRNYRRSTVFTAAMILGLALLVSTGNVYPYQPSTMVEQDVEDNDWFTIEYIQEYGEYVNEHTDPGDKVFTAQPLYVIESDRRIALDLSRKYYLFRHWEDPFVETVEAELIEELAAEETSLAIVNLETRFVLERELVRDSFTSQFCGVESDAHAETDGEVYVRGDPGADCAEYEHRRPDW